MKQKKIFFGDKNKQTQNVLSLFGVYEFEGVDAPENFFEFKNFFLKENTQFIFLEKSINEKFKKEIEDYFFENYSQLRKLRTSISFLNFSLKKNRWFLEAVKLSKK